MWEKKNETFENNQEIRNLSVKELTLDEIESIDFPRLKLLNYKEWLKDGSHVYVSFLNGKPVGFAHRGGTDYRHAHRGQVRD